MSAPLIIAHRGDSAHAPENTIAAFKRAVNSGADGIEFDVRLSKDGVPVAIHDATLARTAGINKRVKDLTVEELSRVDAGSWFGIAYPARARSEFAAEGVPTLRSVLQLLETVSGPVYIELKCETDEDVSSLVEAVCTDIAYSPLQDRIIVGSFNLAVLPRIRAVFPRVQTAALFTPKIMRLLRKEKYLLDIAREFGAGHLSVHKSLVSRKLARMAEKYGIPVTVWTVDTGRWIAKATKQGLFAVITNDPSRMLSVRESMLPRRKPEEISSHAEQQRAD